MSDNLDWTGKRFGSYQVFKRYAGVSEEVGVLYGAHHVETGAPALLLMPARKGDWPPSTSWSVQLKGPARDGSFLVKADDKSDAPAPPLHEVSPLIRRLSTALLSVEDREDLEAHLRGGSVRSRRWRRALLWGLVGAAVALGVGLAFWHGF